jgi:alpha-L-glutamate ligase-like protein
MFAFARSLRRNGVLGLNERNASFIQRFNERRLYPLVDNKLRTKRLAIEAGIAVPALYGVIASQHDARDIGSIVGERHDFVVKPAHGTGGDGILVVQGRSARKNHLYQLADGDFISEDGIRHHVSNIVSGQYSFVGSRDSAMFEYRVATDPFFACSCIAATPSWRWCACRRAARAAKPIFIRVPSGSASRWSPGARSSGCSATTSSMIIRTPASRSANWKSRCGMSVLRWPRAAMN